jgi:hypothetical protein
VNRLAVAWPGIALTLTFIDDLVAGPILAIAGGLLGPTLGIPLATVIFTLVIGLLVVSVHAAAGYLDAGTRARVESAVERASARRFIGRFVRSVGDHRPIPTALVAMLISPVLAVLLARLTHPEQRGHATLVVAALAYGLAFSLAYAAGGSAIAGLA